MNIAFDTDRGMFHGTLDDTPAAKAFADLLPLQLEFSDYERTEKVADLPARLSTLEAPSGYAASAGDITYYSPWGNLAIFYRPFEYAPGLIRLGMFTTGVQDLPKMNGAVTVRAVALP